MFVSKHKLKLYEYPVALRYEVANNQPVYCTHYVKAHLSIQQFSCFCNLTVMPELVHEYDILLGADWLTVQGALVDYIDKSLTLRTPKGRPVLLPSAISKGSCDVCLQGPAARLQGPATYVYRVLPHAYSQDPVDPVVWYQDPVGQDPVVWCQDPVDPVVRCQDPVGQDPVGVQQDPVVRCQDPVVPEPCGVVPGPCAARTLWTLWCQDPVVRCQDPVSQNPVAMDLLQTLLQTLNAMTSAQPPATTAPPTAVAPGVGPLSYAGALTAAPILPETGTSAAAAQADEIQRLRQQLVGATANLQASQNEAVRIRAELAEMERLQNMQNAVVGGEPAIAAIRNQYSQ
ncbi:hypothetical protein QJQ45_001123 [Haematococcus lacustris]|nr:hypothetical protein QJQ45_001123 [Haematococcus lacustris]